MHKTFMKFVGTYATFSDIFGTKIPEDQVITVIKNLPLGGILNILSQLHYLPLNDKTIRSSFVKYVSSLGIGEELVEKKLKDRVLYSEQGILFLWKWLLAYGDETKLTEETDIYRGINQILFLILATADYMSEPNEDRETLHYELFCNIAFNTNNDFRSVIARACYIFDNLAKKRELYNEKEYVDFNKDFEERYGYTVKEYLAVVFAVSIGFNNNNRIASTWTKGIENYFSDTSIAQKAKSILEPFMFKYSEGKEWSSDTIVHPWNYYLFKKRPIFVFEHGGFFPISPKLVYELMFEELFHKIRCVYPQDDLRFNRFFGRPFEDYVSSYMATAVEKSSIPYVYIPEFIYEGKRSPDIMLRLGDKLLAIETKSKRMKMNSVILADKPSIDEDIRNMVVAPLLQITKRLKELQQLSHPSVNGVHEIYIMVVTLGDVPTLQPFEIEVDKILREETALPFKYFYHLDIEEYELFCYQISRKNSHPIFRLLDNKAKQFPFNPFKNFLFASHLPSKRLDKYHNAFLKEIDNLSSILFPPPIN